MRSPAEIFESVLRPCVWVLIVGLLGLGYAGDALAKYEMVNGMDGVEGDPDDSSGIAGGGGDQLGGGDSEALQIDLSRGIVFRYPLIVITPGYWISSTLRAPHPLDSTRVLWVEMYGIRKGARR